MEGNLSCRRHLSLLTRHRWRLSVCKTSLYLNCTSTIEFPQFMRIIGLVGLTVRPSAWLSVCLPVFCVRLWMTCLLTAFINFLRFSLCIWLRRKKSEVCPELPLHCTEPWLHFCLWLLRFKYWSESISSHFEFTGCQTQAVTKRVMQFVFFFVCRLSFFFRPRRTSAVSLVNF